MREPRADLRRGMRAKLPEDQRERLGAVDAGMHKRADLASALYLSKADREKAYEEGKRLAAAGLKCGPDCSICGGRS